MPGAPPQRGRRLRAVKQPQGRKGNLPTVPTAHSYGIAMRRWPPSPAVPAKTAPGAKRFTRTAAMWKCLCVNTAPRNLSMRMHQSNTVLNARTALAAGSSPAMCGKAPAEARIAFDEHAIDVLHMVCVDTTC